MDTNLRRTILWILIAVYTLALPDAIVFYNAITKNFTVHAAQKVPIATLLLFGASYVVFGLITKKKFMYYFVILPSALIILLVVFLEPNPNKHIHIPEYLIMDWLLYEALSVDYRGSGILLLVFLSASMLGVVDELLQGIHPGRYYGWIDMGINSASSLIGVFVLAGLKNKATPDWVWANHLFRRKASLWHLAFGAAGAALLCVYFFNVQAAKAFRGVYPTWLLIWNCVFLALTPAVGLYDRHRCRERVSPADEKGGAVCDSRVTADLWIVTPIAILFAMHVIAVFAVFSGMPFS